MAAGVGAPFGVGDVLDRMSRGDGRPHVRLLGGSLSVFLAEGLVLPTGLIIAAFLSRQLGPTGYGLFALAVATVGAVEWLIVALLSRATIKLVSEAGDWRPVAVAVLRWHLGIGVAVGAACWISAEWVAQWLGVPVLAGCLRILALQVPLTSLAAACHEVLVARGRIRPRALSAATRWSTRLVFILLLVGAGFGVPGALVASLGAVTMGWIVAHGALRVSPFERAAAGIGASWRLAASFFALSLSLRLLDRTALVAIQALGRSVTEAGYYAAAQNFTLGPGLFAMSLSPLLLAALGHARRESDAARAREIGQNALRAIFLALPLAGLGAGASRELVTLVYGPHFAPAAPMAAWLAFGGLAAAGLSVTSAIFAALDRQRVALAVTAPVAPLALAGCVVLVPWLGALGAAAMTASAATVSLLASLVALRMISGLAPPGATLCRAAGLTALAWGAAAWWPAPGLLVLVKGVVIGVGVLVAFATLGEFGGKEWRSSLPGRALD